MDKNSLRIFLTGLIAILCVNLGYSQKNQKAVSLFNGKDLSQWEMTGDEPGFEVKQGMIVTTVQNGSNLFTKKQYGNYILRLEYMLSEVGNSGVLIRSDPANAWVTGAEVQLLAPWTPYRDDLHCTGSLYGLVAVTNRPDETTGIWHQMEILCDRQYIRISVDGETTTEAHIDTVEGFQDKNLKGAIGLQSNHSHPSEFAKFKNLTIIDLDADPDYVLKGFMDGDGLVRQQAYEAAADLGNTLIPDLAMMLDSNEPVLQKGARQALFGIIAKATSPDTGKRHYKEVKKTLQKSHKNAKSKMARQYTDWLLYVLKGEK